MTIYLVSIFYYFEIVIRLFNQFILLSYAKLTSANGKFSYLHICRIFIELPQHLMTPFNKANESLLSLHEIY